MKAMTHDVSLVFTAYVRAFEAGGAAPDPELFERFWSKLRMIFVGEIKKRTMWTASPGYLGVYGAASWSDEAIDEALVDVYAFLLDRLPSLRAQLRLQDNVEGLVFRNLHNYLYDVQRRHDPLGFRVFDVAQRAVRRLLRDGRLHLLRGPAGVRNDTVVGFEPEVAVAADADWDALVRTWNDDLLPDLVTARGRAVDEAAARLAERLPELNAAGVGAFRFKDLVDPLKRDVRLRWSELWSREEGEIAFEQEEDALTTVVWRALPDSDVEDRDAFAKLVTCMTEALESSDVPPATRDELGKLWILLRHHAAADEDERPPSGRQASRLLGIPRDRLPSLQAVLGEWLERCRRRLSAATSRQATRN